MSDYPLSNAIILICLLFCATLTVGWVATVQNPSVGQSLMKMFQKEVAGQISETNPFDMFTKLFANNLEACILLFLGGASFGIFTIFIMSLNGIVIGAVMEIVHRNHSPLFVAAAILPHGIFEIPAFIIAGALGIQLAQSLIVEWYEHTDTAANAYRYARVFAMYVLPLLVTAAAVEAFITPAVVQLVA